MTYCPDCGSPLPDGEMWCRKCRWNKSAETEPEWTDENAVPLTGDLTCFSSQIRNISPAAKVKYIIMTAVTVMLIAVIIVLSAGLKRLRREKEFVPAVTEKISYMPVGDISPGAADPSGWTNPEIIGFATDAVNRTKGYAGTVTAEHTEIKNASVTSVSGGVITRNIAKALADANTGTLKETLVYSGGTAVDSAGNVVDIFLPVNAEFSLDEDGIISATAARNVNDTVIVIDLAPETGTPDAPAAHNRGVLGGLVGGCDTVRGVTVTGAEYTYPGTTVKLTVGADGLVRSASYSVPMRINCGIKAGGISGTMTIDGVLNETWLVVQ